MAKILKIFFAILLFSQANHASQWAVKDDAVSFYMLNHEVYQKKPTEEDRKEIIAEIPRILSTPEFQSQCWERIRILKQANKAGSFSNFGSLVINIRFLDRDTGWEHRFDTKLKAFKTLNQFNADYPRSTKFDQSGCSKFKNDDWIEIVNPLIGL